MEIQKSKAYPFEAVIFDLDGVITKTALVHAASWKEMFDEYLRLREKRDGEPFTAFTHENDYLPYVDGKPRYKGVQSFLESRNIQIPFGTPEDASEEETICGLGNRKNVKFQDVLERQGVEIYPSTVRFIKSLKEAGIKIGVASSSKNCRYVLESSDLETFFETRVDGEISVQLGLKGKPAADIFVVAAKNLGVFPEKAIVVEDAVSGVQAGRNGRFGLVIGIARENNEEELSKNGADIVIPDFGNIPLETIAQWFEDNNKE